MAAAAATPVVGDLHDPKYLNWLKSNRALHRTIDVLRDACGAEMNSFHKLLLGKHGNTQCSKPCTHKDVSTVDKGSTLFINCKNNCSYWLDDIVKERYMKTTKLFWHNSNFSQWQKDPWQIANIFINKKSISPTDTDDAGVLQLWMNCKRFENMIKRAKVVAVSSFYFLSESAIECHINVPTNIFCYEILTYMIMRFRYIYIGRRFNLV